MPYRLILYFLETEFMSSKNLNRLLRIYFPRQCCGYEMAHFKLLIPSDLASQAHNCAFEADYLEYREH